MPNRYDRADKLNEEMKHAFVSILQDVKDPRMPDIVSVVRVEVTRDLRYARVYVSSLGDQAQRDSMMQALGSATGFIRRELGKRFHLHYTPEPQFILDTSIEYAARMSEMINSVSPKGETKDAEDD